MQRNHRYTKAGMREAHIEQLDYVFRARTVPNAATADLIGMRHHMSATLAKLHPRYIWRRDSIEGKLKIVIGELMKRDRQAA